MNIKVNLLDKKEKLSNISVGSVFRLRDTHPNVFYLKIDPQSYLGDIKNEGTYIWVIEMYSSKLIAFEGDPLVEVFPNTLLTIS